MSDRLKRLGRSLKSRVMSKSSTPKRSYPPELPESRASTLINEVKDWQLNHGSLLKMAFAEDINTVPARPIGATIFPSPFPWPCYEYAYGIQCSYNKLYAAVASDEAWLEDVLQDLIQHDRFVATLWKIHLQVKEYGYLQELNLGLFRSDYMLSTSASERIGAVSLRQVEFNGIACAGGVHSNRISDMHRHLAKTGAYRTDFEDHSVIDSDRLRACHTTEGIVSGLAMANALYGPGVTNAKLKGILMVVQPFNVNVCDERPIEYGLWSVEGKPVPLYRVLWGEVLDRTAITSSGALLFQTPHGESMEVSVVYLRAGLDEEEYDDIGIATRIQLEKSRAIKCPSVLSHMSTFKKVQQALAAPGVLQRFVTDDWELFTKKDAEIISETFVPMFPMDESENGLIGRELALKAETAARYVLKPSLEGGGHNVYGEAIPEFLSGISKSRWGNYILMEMIVPPVIHNVLMSPRELYAGSVRSELGIFGQCIWRQRVQQREAGAESQSNYQIILNEREGYSFKTKAEGVDEMSVVKGYGCFDSPLLVDFETFQALCQA